MITQHNYIFFDAEGSILEMYLKNDCIEIFMR